MKTFKECIKSLCFVFCVCMVFSLQFISCSSNSKDGFTEYTLDGDLSWLEGEWELVKWEVDDHGNVVDRTTTYEYERLIIAGGARDSVLRDETKSPGKDASGYDFTVESYLFATNAISNKVNGAKNEIKHVREYAMDPEVVFHYIYRKR
ncbi:MAG: hypothetical protein IKQ43_09760 [Treponema sp.]|nr:hypothetical protein [Treponema sp.]